MAGPFRERMNAARRSLHKYMQIDALYYKRTKDGTPPLVREITCRVWDKFLRIGDLAGTNFNYAETEENSPRAIFFPDEIGFVPEVRHVITTSEGDYILDTMLPPDGISVTFNLKRISSQNDRAGLVPFSVVKRVYMDAQLPGMVGAFDGE